MTHARAPIGVVAGSGIDLRALLDRIDDEQPFTAFPELAGGAVEGHDGRFVRGSCLDRSVVVQCGRLHFYEGLDYASVVQPIDALAGFGVGTVILTNAAGGLRPEMAPGDTLAVERALPFTAYRCWQGQPQEIATDFQLAGCDHRGTYVWVHGPSYETRAEIAALQHLDGAAVGMSTFPELQRCRELGIRAAAVSCITNSCCTPQALSHDHVVETAQRASEKLVGILRGWIEGERDGAVG
jgi:purine-nucleoside phosphorylase